MTIEEKFNQFWQAYPRKAGKGKARDSFKRAIKKVEFEILLEATKEFAECVSQWPAEQRGGQTHFVPYPTTWLNQERWEDDRSEWKRFIANGAALAPHEAWALVAAIRKRCENYSASVGTVCSNKGENAAIIAELPEPIRQMAQDLWGAMNQSDNPSQVFMAAYRARQK